MTLVAILAHWGITVGCGAVVIFFLPAIRRAARIGYGLNVRGATWFAVFFFIACGALHFFIGWQLIFAASHSLHGTLASGFGVFLTVGQAMAMLGTFMAVLHEVVVPFTRGWHKERDEELAIMAKTIVKAARELREEEI